MDRCERCGMLPKHVGLGVCVECFDILCEEDAQAQEEHHVESVRQQQEIDAEHEAMVRELRDEAWYDHESDFVY
jgi:hypothetical protein